MSDEIRFDVIEESLRELRDLVQQLATQAPLGYSSITEGALRVASEEGLIVEGSALVSGVLDVLGRVSVRGLGILEVLSLIRLAGSMRVEGGGDITLDGGELDAGNVKVRQNEVEVGGGESPATLRDGAMEFETGGKVEADAASGGVRLAAGAGNKVYVGAGIVAVQLAGGGVLAITESGTTISDPNGVTINADMRVTGQTNFDPFDTVSGVEPNVYIDPSTGRLQRIL